MNPSFFMQRLNYRREILILTMVALVSFIPKDSLAQCGCKFIITTNNSDIYFDGAAKGVKPGDKICLPNGTRTGIQFKNIIGTPAQPVIITNICDGKSVINAPLNWGNAIEFINSSNFVFTGSGNPAVEKGIEITGAQFGVNFRAFTTDFTVDHLDVHDTGCSGVVAKTDPTCDPKTQLGGFVLRNATFHDINITNTGCEGFYIGNSHFDIGVTKTCNGQSVRLYEHALDNIKVYNCILKNIGNDGIQVGGATNAIVRDNQVLGAGLKNNESHMNGIQLGSGSTRAVVYNNYVDAARGFGVFDSGGGGKYFNNIVTNAFLGGFFLKDDAPNYAPAGFQILNNTIIHNINSGIYILTENPNQSVFYNNIIVGKGAYTYIQINNGLVKYAEANNFKTNDFNTVRFVDFAAKNFQLQPTSPAVNFGRAVGTFGVTFDHLNRPRPNGNFDAGAFEIPTSGPTSNAGADKTINLPLNSTSLTGSGTSGTGITGYLWTKKSGGAATLANETTPTLSVTGLQEGTYVFELAVTDASGTARDEVSVFVLPAAVNQTPTANAGPDRIVILPTNTATISGTGADPDGSILTYNWTKLSGPNATLAGAATPALLLSDLLEGTYIFQLAVSDDKGATATDQMTLTVQAAAVNQVPVVKAGADQSLFTPTATANLIGTATDADGTIASVIWELRSGPPAQLANQATLNLTASSLVPGSYLFRLTATDNQGAVAFDEVVVNVIEGNKNPTVNAGADRSITLPTSSINITATASDADGSITAFLWAQVSGPNSATITNGSSATVSLSNLVAGTYRFSCTATDNQGATGSDEVLVSVVAAPANQPPVASAGADATVTLPVATFRFTGSGTDADGTIASYQWAQRSGPACTLSGQTTAILDVSNLVAGAYLFELTVTDDDGATAKDAVLLTVLPETVNQSPVVNGGGNKSISLPQNTTTFTAVAADPDGTIATYLWTQVSGTPLTLTGTQTATLQVAGITVEGQFIFRIQVTDNGAATASDFVTLTVKASNQSPIVDAGKDQTLVLPVSGATLTATASDADGTLASYAWSKVSGPSATLSGQTTAVLSISALVQGVYVFNIEITDDDGATASDQVQVTVLPLNSNIPPTVNAGPDEVIFLPTNSENLAGSASDPGGAIASYLWTQVSGPPATLINAASATLTATNLIEGTYVFRLTATDDLGASAFDEASIIVRNETTNRLPIVNAGSNTNIQLPKNTILLNGTASDPDGSIATYRWEKLQGPAATLTNSTTANLTVTGMVAGTYIFRLTVTDNSGGRASSDVRVVVLPASVNLAPIADAGSNQTLILPSNNTILIASASDPDGTIASFSWSKVSGPASHTLTGAANSTATLSNLVEGVYVFRVVVADNSGATNSDEVTITVVSASANKPPVAQAGGNQSITLPTTSINLIGTGSDTDGSIATYSWTKVSGGAAVLSNANTPVLTASGLVAGTYVFRLRVTDNLGAIDDDLASVIVNPASLNQPPIANAGNDVVLFSPTSATTLMGSGSDADGKIVSFQWEQIQGKIVKLTNATNAQLLVSELTEGDHIFRLTVTDNSGSKDFDEVKITVRAATVNVPPVVQVKDTTLTLPLASFTFAPFVDDSDGTISTYFWRKLQGPAVTLSGETTAQLNISAFVAGTYKFQLDVIDNANSSAFAVATVLVLPPPPNLVPIVNAGTDQSITLPVNEVTLNGTATDTDGTIASTAWTKVSGPAASITTPASVSTTVTGLLEGTYLFRLQVRDDKNALSTDDVIVTVRPVPPNEAPRVTTPSNMSVVLPQTAPIAATGSATDPDGTIQSVRWSQLNGPAPATLTNTNLPTMNITDLVEGIYTFQLEATDDKGLAGKATFTLIASAPPIDPNGPPLVSAGVDIVLIAPENSVTIVGSAVPRDPDETITLLEWSQVSGTTATLDPSGALVQISGLTEGVYVFRLTASTGEATVSDDVSVGVIGSNNEIPKFFSPNGDGIGDVWFFRNPQRYEGCGVNVFNRNGFMVFSAEPYLNNWDGTSVGGSKLADGDYYYVMACPDGRQIKGGLRIIR